VTSHEHTPLPGLPPSQCSTCKAAVIWGRTAKGRPMPVDAEPVADGEWMLERGALVYQGPGPSLLPGARYRSHFATCADADLHRRPRTAP
jgi:hypothetical protein